MFCIEKFCPMLCCSVIIFSGRIEPKEAFLAVGLRLLCTICSDYVVTIVLMPVFFVCRAVYMFYLIERSRKCLDFSATLYIVHLFICIVYGGWPSSITWWIVNGSGIAVMALLGERLCMKRELQEISLTRFRSSKSFLLREYSTG